MIEPASQRFAIDRLSRTSNSKKFYLFRFDTLVAGDRRLASNPEWHTERSLTIRSQFVYTHTLNQRGFINKNGELPSGGCLICGKKCEREHALAWLCAPMGAL